MHSLSLIDHLRELKKRVLYSCIAIVIGFMPAYFFHDLIIHYLSIPFSQLPGGLTTNLFITSLFEGFLTKIKFSLIFSIVMSSPILFYHFIRFVFPALKPKEKRIIIFATFSSVILAAGSFYLSYFKLLPFSVGFLTSSNFLPQNIGILLNYQQNIFYIFNFIIFALIAFQFPILLEALLYLNLVSRKMLLKSSRFIIIGIFIFSAIVTPPDIVSQCGIALPLILLFYITILIAKVFKWGEA